MTKGSGKTDSDDTEGQRRGADRRGSVYGIALEPARFEVDRPVSVAPSGAHFGSDLVAETLRELDIPFLAMRAGPSLAALNDSLVNYLGNTRPQLITCLDDETALAVAFGHARVTGRPMAVALTDGGSAGESSALATAQRDAVPLLVLQATSEASPAGVFHADLAPRPPDAARQALLQACRVAETLPHGPVRVVLNPQVLCARAEAPDRRRNLQRFRARVHNGACARDVVELAAILREAERPLILLGRMSRDEEAWNNRVILAEILGARVHAAADGPAAFPTDHPLFLQALSPRDAQDADVLLSLGCPDLDQLARGLHRDGSPAATIIEVAPDVTGKRTGTGTGQRPTATPTPSDILIEAGIDALVTDLVAEMNDISSSHRTATSVARRVETEPGDARGGLARGDVSAGLARLAETRKTCIAAVPEGWDSGKWSLRGPLDFLGRGTARPGQCVGSALALTGSGRITIGLLEEAGFVAGASALWTAAHYHVPLLLVVIRDTTGQTVTRAQAEIARTRGRSTENAWIGHSISHPGVDIRGLAGAFGALGLAAGSSYNSLATTLAQAVDHVDGGGVAVVEVTVSRSDQ